jgi:3'-phosphoadenosine 5'-phosphosulfate sulfotransferase (PAPS reductase)/FAD synthetase
VIELPATIQRFCEDGALFVINDSGGKDSQAMRIALMQALPPWIRRESLVVIHASLGEVEWPGALEHAKAGAERSELPFVVAEARKTFFEMVEHRFKVRPGPNSSCWPSAANRQCTSDLKRGPIERELRRMLWRFNTYNVVTCMGIRAEESPARSKLEPLRRSDRNSKAGRDWYEWLPIFNFTRRQVFDTIVQAGEKPHPAYAAGNDRLSCMFCIMGSKNDLRNAAIANPELYAKYVEVEQRTGYTMHQSRVPLTVLTGIPVGGASC